MFCFFFSVDSIIVRIIVPKGKTVTDDFYANEILPKVFNKFKRKHERKTVHNILLHYDNALLHDTSNIKDFLNENQVKLLPHPPYSPDLVLCDFFLFSRIKKELGEKNLKVLKIL